MKENNVARNLVVSLSGEFLSKIPLYLFEFLLASWLLVNEYAEWAVMILFVRMGPYLHLGALSYFNKCYPLLIGEGSQVQYLVIKETSGIINSLFLIIFINSFGF